MIQFLEKICFEFKFLSSWSFSFSFEEVLTPQKVTTTTLASTTTTTAASTVRIPTNLEVYFTTINFFSPNLPPPALFSCQVFNRKSEAIDWLNDRKTQNQAKAVLMFGRPSFSWRQRNIGARSSKKVERSKKVRLWVDSNPGVRDYRGYFEPCSRLVQLSDWCLLRRRRRRRRRRGISRKCSSVEHLQDRSRVWQLSRWKGQVKRTDYKDSNQGLQTSSFWLD